MRRALVVLAIAMALAIAGAVAASLAHAQDTPGPPSPTEQPGPSPTPDTEPDDDEPREPTPGLTPPADSPGPPSPTEEPQPEPSPSPGPDPDPDRPETSPAPERPRDTADLEGFAGDSPMCDEERNAMKLEAGGIAQRNCSRSGSIAQPHPTAHYGLDQNVDIKVTEPETMIAGALHSGSQTVWLGLVYMMRGALAIVELGFSHSLVLSSMAEIRSGIARLKSIFLADSWQVAALTVLGLWGIWMGLVRRKTINTIGGIATAVGLMIGAQVIMINPEGTVGKVATLSNEGALVALGAASTGDVDKPADTFAVAHQRLFTSLVVRPWCALQFTDVEGCMKVQNIKDGPNVSIADVWLSFPSNSPEREKLYDNRKGEPFKLEFTPEKCKRKGWKKLVFDDIASDYSGLGMLGNFSTWACEKWNGPDGSGQRISLRYNDEKAGIRTDATIQSGKGAFTRLGMLALIAAGMVGAIAVLLWIGVRLLLTGVFSLVLILLTPIVFLLAAFGEGGRRSVVAWGQRLLGLLIAKFVFALMLAVVVLIANIIQGLDVGWTSIWMFNIAYWWGLLLKRRELLGFLTLERPASEGGLGLAGSGRGGSGGLSSLYYGWRMANDAFRQVRKPFDMAADAGRNRAARTADKRADRDADAADRADATHERGQDDRGAQTAAIREHDREELGAEASRGRDVATHRDDLRKHRDKQRERRKAEQELKANRARQAALAAKHPPKVPTTAAERKAADEQRALKQREGQLRGKLDAWRNDPSRTKRPVLTNSDPVKGRELDDYISARREEISTLPPEHERNLLAAGIDPDRYRRAGSAEKDALRERSADAMDRSRTLLETATAERPMTERKLRKAWERIDAGPRGTRTRQWAQENREQASRATRDRNAERTREEARRTRQHERERRARRREDEARSRARRGVR
ncbi:APC family permease [Conexibacter woesei]|uniref:Uncharacterized protein n=1 Tax=Conexibacter woesei (strain DSM 14684 / CCUG 47730 / CIP 108061 / JCM 11494 / NBRC 100937 / ID131577) TaxID=469383 RepID=D3EZ00_CONWI|nr:hypothetical protein [Conexibacter woesei]ADB49874.1 hypothetical protein Cwoe_1446 [Conexibacter woesei DSM 14684]